MSDFLSAARTKLRTVIIMVSVIGPLVGLMICVYDSLVTRYLARHLVIADDPADFAAGQVVAVTGSVRANPVRCRQAIPNSTTP